MPPFPVAAAATAAVVRVFVCVYAVLSICFFIFQIELSGVRSDGGGVLHDERKK